MATQPHAGASKPHSLPDDLHRSVDEPKVTARGQLSKIQEEIFLKLQDVNDHPDLLADESFRRRHDQEIALLRVAESNTKDMLARLERDEERAEKQAQRRADNVRNILAITIAGIGLLVAAASLWTNKINAEANRAIAEWNQERAKAMAQWDDPVEFVLVADGLGRLLVHNDSVVEALNFEVRRTRLFYSPTCKVIFYHVGHTWAWRERLAPRQSVSLTLYEPFKISQATLSRPRGECARLPNGEPVFNIAIQSNEDLVLGAPVEIAGSVGILPEEMAKRLKTSPLCSTGAPCKVVEYVQATAVHGKKFERRIFEEFFLNMPDGAWKPSESFKAGGSPWSFEFADPEMKTLFVAVAEWLKGQANPVWDTLRPTGKPFRVGIWAATGVAPPVSPDGGPSQHSN